MTKTNRDRLYLEQSDVFERLYESTESLLRRFESPDFQPGQPHGDYFVHGDYNGHPQIVVFVENLAMLRPNIVSELQRLIREYPGWQIVVTVAVRGHFDDWPNMGLYIRPHEIVDGLQREYFPKEFQYLEYEGARRVTVLG
jgi:hypothetical protein